jgi:hypothetical protein
MRMRRMGATHARRPRQGLIVSRFMLRALQ